MTRLEARMRKLALVTTVTTVTALFAAAAAGSLVPATLALADEPTTVTMSINRIQRYVDVKSLPGLQVMEPF